MSRVRPIPPVLQVLYSELLERAVLDAASQDGAVAATPVLKTVKGKSYWYLQDTKRDKETGRQRQTYFGPDSEQTRRLIQSMRDNKRSSKDRRELVASLKSIRLASPHPVMAELLMELAASGFFDQGGCVVGTVAYQTYEGLLGVKFTGAFAATQDVDIATRRIKALAVVPPAAEESFLDRLRKLDPSFAEVPGLGKEGTGIYRNDAAIRVDVLTPAKGSRRSGTEYVAAIKSYAQRLDHLDYLLENPVKAVILHDSGILVNVPSPQRFAVHKLIVSQSRSGIDHHKITKDYNQAESLLEALLLKDRGHLKTALEEAWSRGKGWRKKIVNALESVDAAIGEELKTLAPELLQA